MRTKDIEAYELRNAILKRMGFDSYLKYLESKLWRGIRKRVLKANRWCYCCDRYASQVHHIEYTEENLTGKDIESLVSVCGICHSRAETWKGRCLGLSKANKRLAARRNNGLRRWIRENDPEVMDLISQRNLVACRKMKRLITNLISQMTHRKMLELDPLPE